MGRSGSDLKGLRRQTHTSSTMGEEKIGSQRSEKTDSHLGHNM